MDPPGGSWLPDFPGSWIQAGCIVVECILQVLFHFYIEPAPPGAKRICYKGSLVGKSVYEVQCPEEKRPKQTFSSS
jgi:hypothetical protein